MSITVSSLRTTENLWPNAIRSRASHSKPFATVVSPDGQLENVSFSDLENASNRAAWFLDQNCPEDGTFFYMGPSDIRYLIWVIASMKTGKCVVFPSPGNSVPANRKLFLAVGAKKFLFAAEFSAMSKPLQEATGDIVQSQVTPSYAELLNRQEVVPVYPFEKTWDEIKLTKFMALHMSGTSGHPKPIYWNHLAATVLASFLDDRFVGPNGTNLSQDLFVGMKLLMPFPLFHMGGMASAMSCVFSDNTLVLPKSGTPLSPPNYTAMLDYADCTATFAPPAVLEALLAYPPGLASLSKLDHVAYTGGPLQPSRGAELAKHVKHLSPSLRVRRERMQETTPGFYELVFPRTERVEQTYGFFHVYPHLKREYRTSDLLSPVTDKDGWWVYRGRADNWVVMTNGLKMDPTDIENAVSSHPKVKGVLVAGSHRFRLCMLVELKDDDDRKKDEASVVGDIWPLIEQANANSPKFGRVPRELIITAKSDKPFLRASKGTIQRQLTIEEYKDEIDDLYKKVEDGLLSSGLLPIASTKAEHLAHFLTDLYQQTLDLGSKAIGLDDDLIGLGLDSLTAFIILARLKAALREHGVSEDQLKLINPKLLYSAAVRKVTDNLSTLLNGSSSDESLHETQDFEELLAKYTLEVKNLAKRDQGAGLSGAPKAGGDRKETLILTGSTGSLGSYILASLLASPSNKSIVCLNRDTPAAARVKQEASFVNRGLPPLPDSDDGRVRFMQAQLSEPNLGLSSTDYAALVRDATCVIHNAFPVNWLLGVSSFEPQLLALVRLLEFVGSCSTKPDLVFVSSIAAATPVDSSYEGAKKIAENVVSPDLAPRLLLRQGYAQAKYICERMLELYSSSSSNKSVGGIDVLRVGQICGPVESGSSGTWNPSEWLPSLVISSVRFLKAVPESLGPALNDDVNWIPVDKLAKIVCELLYARETRVDERFVIYNVVNPQPTSWHKLLPALDSIVPRRNSPAEWVEQIEAGGRVGGHEDGLANLHRNPALKLIDFYKQSMLGTEERNALGVDSSNLLRVSETARSLGPITQENLTSWMESWAL